MLRGRPLCLLHVFCALAILPATFAAEVTGRVWAGDAPLFGARLLVVSKSVVAETEPAFQLVFSDENGSFSAELDAPGPFLVHAAAVGFSAQTIESAGGSLEIHLSRGRTVRGQVLDRTAGRPLTGVRVTLQPPDSQSFPAEVRDKHVHRHTNTNEEGRFAFTDIGTGQPRVVVEAEGYERAGRTLLVSRDSDTSDLLFALDAGVSLSGRIVDTEDRAIAGARVQVLPRMGGPRRASRNVATRVTLTDDSGAFALEGLPAEPGFRVSVRADGFAPLQSGVDARDGEIEFVLDRGARVSFHLADAEGERLPCPRTVLILDASPDARWRMPVRSYEGDEIETTKSGCELSSVPTGAVELRMTADGFMPTVRELTLEAGELHELGPISVPGDPSVRGRVLDASGAGVAGARVTITPARRGRGSWGGGGVATTGGDGGFRLAGVDLDQAHSVRVEQDGFSPTEQRVEDLSAPLLLTLNATGTLRGRVLRKDLARPAAGFTVSLTRQQEASSTGSGRRRGMGALRRQIRQGRSETFVAAPEGRFVIEALEPGSYAVEVSAPGCVSVREAPVVVAAGRSNELGEVSIAPGARLEGVVVEGETGAPVAGASVRRVRPGLDVNQFRGEGPVEGSMSDGDGRFVLDGLPHGPLKIDVEHDAFAPASVEFQIMPGEPLPFTTVELGQGGSIYGRVRNEAGELLAGARVIVATPSAPGSRRMTETDENGLYLVERLRPGSYTVVSVGAADPGAQRGRRGFGAGGLEMQQVVLESGESLEVDFPDPGADTLLARGQIRRAGAPLANAQLFLTREGQPGMPAMAETDEAGRFDTELPGPGQYSLRVLVVPDGSTERRVISAQLRVEITRDNAGSLELTLPEALVAGFVRDALSGEALNYGSLSVLKRGEDDAVETIATSRTRKDGSFEISALPDGEFSLLVSAPGRAAQVVGPFELEGDDELDDLSLSLEAARPLAVHVESGAGEVLTGILVIPLGQGEDTWTYAREFGFSDTDGTAWLRTLPDGMWDLAIAGNGVGLSVVEDVELAEGAPEELTVETVPATRLVVEVRDEEDQPIAGAQLQIAEKEGRELTSLLTQPMVARRLRVSLTSDAEGKVALEVLAPGRYALTLQVPGGANLSKTITLSAGSESRWLATAR